MSRKSTSYSQDEMTSLQAEHHDMVKIEDFDLPEDYVLYLIHNQAYKHVSELAASKRVLDLGCNIGYGTETLAKVCISIIGLDVSEKAIDNAKKLFQKENMHFAVYDGKRIPYQDGVFDLVVSFQVIEHIVDYENYLGEIVRILSSAGKAVFTTPNAKIRLEPGMKPWNKFHVKEFSGEELKELLNNYFNEVQILGLFAEQFITEIELKRVKRSLEGYKKMKNHTTRNLIISMLRPVIPKFFINWLKASRKRKRSETLQTLSVEKIKTKLSENSFYYLESDIDNSLDLMAICNK